MMAAMKQTQVVVLCDVCGVPDASTVSIKYADQSVSIDLCEEHVAPITALMSSGQPKKGRGRRRIYDAPAPRK